MRLFKRLPHLPAWQATAGFVCALAACLAAAPAQSEPGLGRLFSTPSERAELDARRGNISGAPVAMPANSGGALAPADANRSAAPAKDGPPPKAEQLELSGVLRRSGGKGTVWLNDEAQPEPLQAQQLTQRQRRGKDGAPASSSVTVTLPSGKRVILKPGQHYDLGEGRVKEVHEP